MVHLLRELVFVLLVHLFVCFALVCFCPLPLGVEGWLRFVIVGYPGPIYYYFFLIKYNDNIMNKVRNREIMIVHTYIHTRSEDERLG